MMDRSINLDLRSDCRSRCLSERSSECIRIFLFTLLVLLLTVPMILYGFVIMNSYNFYPETTCKYEGYRIGQDRGDYEGILEYMVWVNQDNQSEQGDRGYQTTIYYRSLLVIRASTKNKIIKYFSDHYNNQTTWKCWYERSNPQSGWIGFKPPYSGDGEAMVIAGFVIFIVFVFSLILYLVSIKSKYHRITTYDELVL